MPKFLVHSLPISLYGFIPLTLLLPLGYLALQTRDRLDECLFQLFKCFLLSFLLLHFVFSLFIPLFPQFYLIRDLLLLVNKLLSIAFLLLQCTDHAVFQELPTFFALLSVFQFSLQISKLVFFGLKGLLRPFNAFIPHLSLLSFALGSLGFEVLDVLEVFGLHEGEVVVVFLQLVVGQLQLKDVIFKLSHVFLQPLLLH